MNNVALEPADASASNIRDRSLESWDAIVTNPLVVARCPCRHHLRLLSGSGQISALALGPDGRAGSRRGRRYRTIRRRLRRLTLHALQVVFLREIGAQSNQVLQDVVPEGRSETEIGRASCR